MPVHVVLESEVVRARRAPLALCGAKVEGVFIRALRSGQHAPKHICAACRARALGETSRSTPRP